MQITLVDANLKLIAERRLRREMTILQALFPFHKSGPERLDPGEPDRLRKAIAEASSEARTAFFYFALFGLYFIVAVAGTTHEDLLRGSTIAMPGLGVGLPIVGFYAFVPLLFILLHMYVLLQVFIVAHELDAYRKAIAARDDANQTRDHELIASSFLTTQWLVGYTPRVIYTIIVWTSLVILPLLFLVGAQVRFLPYHLDWVTWLHRWYVLIDVLILLQFWFFILKYRNGWLAGPAFPRRRGWRKVCSNLSYLLLAGFSLVTTGFMFLVATVPGENMERCLLADNPSEASTRAAANEQQSDLPFWCSPFRHIGGVLDTASSPDGRRMLAMTYELFEAPGARLGLRRNLIARYARLVVSEPAPDRIRPADETKTADGVEGPPVDRTDELARKEKEAWKRSGKGINLRGRDLRFADLTGSDLRGADLRAADLKGAVLKGALLSFADLGDIEVSQIDECRSGVEPGDQAGNDHCRTQASGADLSNASMRFSNLWNVNLRAAKMEGANLEGAELSNSKLTGADLQFTKLPEAKLWGADLRAANVLGAEAAKADLTCADLTGALLKDAKLAGSKFAGADLRAADLRGSRIAAATFPDEACQPDAENMPAKLAWADLRQLPMLSTFASDIAYGEVSILKELQPALAALSSEEQPVFGSGEERSQAEVYDRHLARQLEELVCPSPGSAQAAGQDAPAADDSDSRRALARGLADRILAEYQHADDQTPAKQDVLVRDAYVMVSGALLYESCGSGGMDLSETEMDRLKDLRCLWYKQHANDQRPWQTLLNKLVKDDGGVRDDAFQSIPDPVLDCPKYDQPRLARS